MALFLSTSFVLAGPEERLIHTETAVSERQTYLIIDEEDPASTSEFIIIAI